MKTHEAKKLGRARHDPDRAAPADVLRYWTALYERGRITEDGALEAACRHGIFTESEGAICSEELT